MQKDLNKKRLKKYLTVFSLISLIIIFSALLSPYSISIASGQIQFDMLENMGGWGVAAVDTETSKVYVTNFKSTTVTVIDGNTNKNVSEIEIGSSPYGIGINSNTKILYIAREHADILTVVNATSGKIIKEVPLVSPYDIAVNSKTNMVYVTSDSSHLVSVLDGSSNQIVTTFKINDPCGIGVNEATNMVYVTSESANKLHVIDGAKNILLSSIDVGKSPRGIIANPRTNLVYVTNQLSGTVDVIDGIQNKIVNTITVETTPRRVVVNPNTNILYVSNQISNSISVIDGSTNQVIDSIPVEQPFELAINPKTNKLYATYFGYPMLSIVNDVVREQDQKSGYSTIISVLAAGALAAGITFFVIQKKKLKQGRSLVI
jgi:YVTN family beta-propeller protein